MWGTYMIMTAQQQLAAHNNDGAHYITREEVWIKLLKGTYVTLYSSICG